ncbi:MAG TPA: YlxR family protein [Bacillota bacterium]|jgi:predicted RNA-binding protein YlxR (DUF448 family)|nr:YlxR family protein [Bacillota bacterium]
MAKRRSQPKVKKVPQRTCVGCREVKSKWDLVRITRTSEGAVEIDPTGKLAGRGAYICPSSRCLNLAAKNKRLDKALGVAVPDEVIERLAESLQRNERL